MLTSILETTSGIMEILNSGGVYNMPVRSSVLPIPVNSARKSAKTVAQKPLEAYPQVAIYDYLPEYDNEWNPNHQKRVDGFHDFTGVNGAPKKAYTYDEPIRFLFRYDVSLYFDNPMHRWAATDFMEKKFPKNGIFILNKVTLPEGDVGDFLDYNVVISDSERQDGIFELTYEFSVKALVLVADPKELDLITNFNININNTNI